MEKQEQDSLFLALATTYSSILVVSTTNREKLTGRLMCGFLVENALTAESTSNGSSLNSGVVT